MPGVFGLGGSASKRRRPSLDGGLVRERPKADGRTLLAQRGRNSQSFLSASAAEIPNPRWRAANA